MNSNCFILVDNINSRLLCLGLIILIFQFFLLKVYPKFELFFALIFFLLHELIILIFFFT